MGLNGLFLESHQMQLAAPPTDLTAATTGDYVSLRDAESVVIVFASGVGTAGDDATISLFQATTNTGTGAKDLNPPAASTFVKQAATDHTSTGQFSDGSGDITANDWTNATNAEQVVLLAIEVRADQLDVDGGFDHIRADIDDTGTNAQPGALLYILRMKEQRAVTNVPSVL